MYLVIYPVEFGPGKANKRMTVQQTNIYIPIYKFVNAKVRLYQHRRNLRVY